MKLEERYLQVLTEVVTFVDWNFTELGPVVASRCVAITRDVAIEFARDTAIDFAEWMLGSGSSYTNLTPEQLFQEYLKTVRHESSN